MTTTHPFGLPSATPFGFSTSTLGKLSSVFMRHRAIDSVVIYGSRAKGNYRAGSDIDLTIKGSEIPFDELMQIEDQIDDLMLPYTVDLSQYRLLENADLIAHIDRVGVEIYANDEGRNTATAESLARAKV